MSFNRLANCKNPFQGSAKRVLCVCSAGLLRSPTLAHMLSAEPYNFNTRAVGSSEEYALIPIDEVLIAWADEIIFVSPSAFQSMNLSLHKALKKKKVKTLNIPDQYTYGNLKLKKILKEQYDSYGT